MKFPERLSEIMEETKVSGYRLSKDTGISDGLISEWRNGAKSPTMESLIKLADYFGVSIDYLVGRSDDPERR